jgi:lipid II:glycine glycyltransferase (peptidoglycan interpeptide bridge formation enzyme)
MQSKDAAPLPSSLYQFKQGFGGEVVHYGGAFDAIYSPLKYALYRAARRIRRSSLG